MKITIYELLGLVKDDKAPKLIKFKSIRYEWIDNVYVRFDGDEEHYLDMDFGLAHFLNDTVEILEEQKKIPEKLEEFGSIQYSLDYIDYKNIEKLKEWLSKDFQTIYNTLDLLIKNQNQLIDYLESKGE